MCESEARGTKHPRRPSAGTSGAENSRHCGSEVVISFVEQEWQKVDTGGGLGVVSCAASHSTAKPSGGATNAAEGHASATAGRRTRYRPVERLRFEMQAEGLGLEQASEVSPRKKAARHAAYATG